MERDNKLRNIEQAGKDKRRDLEEQLEREIVVNQDLRV